MRRIEVALAGLVVVAGAQCHGNAGSGKGTPDLALSSGDLGSGGSGGGGGGGGSGGGGVGDLGAVVTPGDPGAGDVSITVHADQMQRPISPYIYGVNNGSQAAAHHATIVRSGGNRLTAYNWETNASNAGTDYGGCQNDNYLSTSATPGAYVASVVDQAKAAGAAALLTIPIVDYVAGDENGTTNCKFDASRFKNNHAAKGDAFADPPNSGDNDVYQDELVSWLKTHESGATLRFLLDNEPDLWSGTHPEVHPMPVTYAELAMRSISYARAVKAVMPNVEVWGPASYGWGGYVNLQGAPDAAANGDFIEYWLKQMAAAATGKQRLVDGLDLHWYSEVGDGGPKTGPGQDCRVNSDPVAHPSPQLKPDCYTPAGQAGEALEREQAPRSLWDATYVENSWIPGSIGGKAIALIPLMQGKIAKQAPGVKLSFSEWSYGGGSDVSGAIATADTLGIFGATGVDMATLWETWHDESFTYAAFDVFRNFDGKGAAFGDTSVSAASSDVATATVYAAIESASPAKTVLVLINKATTAKTAAIKLYHWSTFTTASVYTLTQAGGAKLVAGTALPSAATNAFKYTMPAQSVSVLVPK